MQVRKWLISGEINYDGCRICNPSPPPPPEGLIPTSITLSVMGDWWTLCGSQFGFYFSVVIMEWIKLCCAMCRYSKFHATARHFTGCGKLWALLIACIMPLLKT